MCRVKSGKMLRNKQDLQNLIIGIINRQENTYDKEKILAIVQYYCKDADIEVGNSVLLNAIDDNLDFLYRKELIDCKDGNYHPRYFFDESLNVM